MVNIDGILRKPQNYQAHAPKFFNYFSHLISKESESKNSPCSTSLWLVITPS